MLESVRNKCKQKDSRKKESNGRDRDRERDRDRSRKSRSNSKKRDRSRSRYSPDRYSRHYRRKYNSRSRSGSRGKYRSRSREIEKAIVPQFSTEFRPRVEKPKPIAKKEEDRKKSPKKVTDGKTKKLPLIGKMPVFKRQTTKDDNIPPSNQSHDLLVIEQIKKTTNPISSEFDDLMPDPVQFASLMAARNNMLPPGVDNADMDYNPMPNIDATILPPASKRPLHKDFEVALDIIFPEEEKQKQHSMDIDNETMNQPLQFKASNSEKTINVGSIIESKDEDDLSFLGIDSEDAFFANY